MRYSNHYAAVFVATRLFSPLWALPTPQAGIDSPDNIGIPTADPVGPPGATGSLRGPTSLLGFNPAIPEATTGSTDIPPDDFQLPPGSTADKDLGFFLDMSNVKNPQPIRGGNGKVPTDPGPRKSATESWFALGSY